MSFVKHMKHKAGNLGVDLLLIDTGKAEAVFGCRAPRDILGIGYTYFGY